MAYFGYISDPVSPDTPCGGEPDNDPALQTFVTVFEGSLPASFREFDRKNFDDKAHVAKITDFLRQYRDIRLLVLAAKTFALSENFAGFFESLKAISWLLENHWADVHPRGAGEDYSLRTAYVQSLEDLPTILLPLQFAPLVKDKRIGPISYRSHMVAKKLAPPRKDDPVHDEQTIQDALIRFEPLDELSSLRDRFTSSLIDLQKIRDLFVAKVSYEASPQFDQLPAFLKGTKELLDSIITQRVPPDISESTSEARGTEENSEDAAAPDRSQDGAALHGEVQTIREASSALHAIVNYYSLAEPSSPARLLVRQAHQLVGKSFVEAMQILAPELVEETRIDITGSLPFSLNFAQLQALAIEDQAAPDEQEEVRSFTVASRQEASELMKAIERCYRKLEPSSPIPLLLERARKFVAKDFATLLREVAKRDDSKDNSFG